MKNNKNRLLKNIVGIILALSPLQEVFSTPYKVSNKDSTLYVSVGKTSVEANELVYCQPISGCPNDYKLSQLIWEVKDNPVLIGGFSFSRKKVRMNLELQTALTEADGVMDDFDWQYVGLDWSDWSHHEDTTLTEHNSLDLNLDYLFYGTADNAWRFLIGYRQSKWAWESRGGSYIYSTVPTDFRDLSGFFTPGERVISYEQEFSFPYIGLKYEGDSGKWKYHFQYEYSNWVSMKATDHHFLRDLIFVDDFSNGSMSAYKVSAAYNISSGLEAYIRYDAREYEELRGSTITRDSNTGGIVGICEDCAGADNTNSTLSIGVSYTY